MIQMQKMHQPNIYFIIIIKNLVCTKFSPNDLRGVSDPTLIDIIIKKIIKSFKKHIINKNEIIDEGEKLLLWNKIIINNEFILKILMKKKVLFVYLVLFKNLLMKIL